MKLSEAARKERAKYVASWRKKNREKCNKYHRQWRSKNRDKIEGYNMKYWETKAINMLKFDTVKPVTVIDTVTVSVTKVISVTCCNCGIEFIPKRKTARFCSDKCRVSYNRKAL
jgi:hypothetical protein